MVLKLINFFEPSTLKLIISLLMGIAFTLCLCIIPKMTIYISALYGIVLSIIILIILDKLGNSISLVGMTKEENISFVASLIRSMSLGISLFLLISVCKLISKVINQLFWLT